MLNETHDPKRVSWVISAQTADTDFPIQNLPFAVFRSQGSTERFRGGVAIGDQVVDLLALHKMQPFKGLAATALAAASEAKLNAFMALGHEAWHALRVALSHALTLGSSEQATLQTCLVAMNAAEFDVPAQIGDYTDFYTSIYHATNIGKLFRPDNPLLPNYKWVPIGYHGRASSIVVSGQAFHRPIGQIKLPDADVPHVAASKRLDIELELAVYVGVGNRLGQSISLAEAEQHVFGIGLLNDWSARDIQGWEYQPLGPFLSKSFATTVSPWVVTLEALAPFRTVLNRPDNDPKPLPYLYSDLNRLQGAFDIALQVSLQTQTMRQNNQIATSISNSNYRYAYWTIAQMVAHHTINGCNLKAGDVLGTGTLSGPSLDQAGALIELTEGGRHPFTLPYGETRTFLEDEDQIELKGWCQKQGFASIGFGQCSGRILPAR
jgi:fumarylacetoacetase